MAHALNAVVIAGIAVFTAGQTSLPYDPASGMWLIDAEGIVSRNDVVYHSPSIEPWEAMPVGGGDLSAMVRCDGESLHLHLTKSDAWGYQAPADELPGTRYFNNVSPGHVRIALGARAKALAEERFRQRLDLYRGRIVLELGSGNETLRIVVWGHPERKVVFVEVSDPSTALESVTVELSEWRDTMEVDVRDGIACAREVHTRPARPHLASGGMQDYFDDATDPMLGRGTAVAVGTTLENPALSAEGQIATIASAGQPPASFTVALAAAVTPKGEPLDPALSELRAALTAPIDQLKEDHAAWWRAYWNRSFLRLESDDSMGRWVTAAWYVHLYTLGCVNRGPVPAKWDGGAGLMRGDERTWGLAEWIQEIRFTYLPLYAANRVEMAKGLTTHYTTMLPYLQEQTRKMWGVEGLWIPETVLPWGGIEDWVLDESIAGCMESYGHWNPESAPYGRFERYNRYVGFLFTAGPELCWHYLTYYQYTGDEAFLRGEAYPVVKGVSQFLAALLREGDDGKVHLDPANGLETWWMVRDPSDTMDALRWLFPEFIRLSERLERDAGLRERCGELLAKLPEPPLGVWHPGGTIDAAIDAYAPAAAPGDPKEHRNYENPALYRVFPFGLSGIGTDDYGRAARTFEHRIFSGNQGWSLDAVWAARLGLRDEACPLLAQHTRTWNRFRYGGWDSGNSSVFPDNLAVVPYTDAPGVAFYALHEILLQSHNGLIRILPAVAPNWSGLFRLRAEGGFLVGVAFGEGAPHVVEIESLSGNPCRLANPWDGPAILRNAAKTETRIEGEILEFATEAGETCLLYPARTPLSEYMPARVVDRPAEGPGLPGRDSPFPE